MVTLKCGRLYRHPKCLDVDLFISAHSGGNLYVVRYWHRLYKRIIGEQEVVPIHNREQWSEVTND